MLWIQERDANTCFFHSMESNRRRANKIPKLQDDNGTWWIDEVGMGRIVKDYFIGLFA